MKPTRVQNDEPQSIGTGFRMLLLDEQPAHRARLTAAEVLDLFRPGTPSPAESRPFIRRRPAGSSIWQLAD